MMFKFMALVMFLISGVFVYYCGVAVGGHTDRRLRAVKSEKERINMEGVALTLAAIFLILAGTCLHVS